MPPMEATKKFKEEEEPFDGGRVAVARTARRIHSKSCTSPFSSVRKAALPQGERSEGGDRLIMRGPTAGASLGK